MFAASRPIDPFGDPVRLASAWKEAPRYGEGDRNRADLLAPQDPLRRMVVLVDADVMRESESLDPFSATSLFADLVKLAEAVDLYRYADGGPPPDVAPVGLPEDSLITKPVYRGWAVVHQPWNERTQSAGVVFESSEGVWRLAGVPGNAVRVAANDSKSGCYEELGPERAAERRFADQLAAGVAEDALRADLFVTRRQFLLTDRARRMNAGVTVCTPEQALPLLGLYLRAQGRFQLDRVYSTNRRRFYWVASRELLPSGWLWAGAASQHGKASENGSISVLALSCFQRVARAVEHRDSVLIAANRHRSPDTGEAALASLDVVLIMLMAAFDVVARVLHRVLALEGKEAFAGWQKKAWMKLVSAEVPAFADAIGTGTQGESVLTIIRLLRNSIHGEALQGAFIRDSSAMSQLVALPERDRAELLDAMEALGGGANWGVRLESGKRVYVDPLVLVERVFRFAIPLLDELIRLTPVERLAGVDISKLDGPPGEDTSDDFDVFDPRYRQAVRLQLGL